MPEESPPQCQFAEVARDLVDLEQERADPHDERVRRQADARLLAILRQERFSGSCTEEFLNELTRYGLAVIGAWLRAGVLGDKAKRVGRPPARQVSVLALTWDDCEALTDVAVVHGLRLFRTSVFEKNEWCPELGASLKTYFIRSCLLTYSNALKSWQPDRDFREIPAELPDFLFCDPGRSPCDAVSDRSAARDLLASIKDTLTRRIVALRYEGLTNRHIAEVLGHGLTEGAVEMRLSRLRRQFMDKRRVGGSEEAT